MIGVCYSGMLHKWNLECDDIIGEYARRSKHMHIIYDSKDMPIKISLNAIRYFVDGFSIYTRLKNYVKWFE